MSKHITIFTMTKRFLVVLAVITTCCLITFPASKKKHRSVKSANTALGYLNFHQQYKAASASKFFEPVTIWWTVDQDVRTTTNYNVATSTTNCPPFFNACDVGEHIVVIDLSGFCDGQVHELSAMRKTSRGLLGINITTSFINVGSYGGKFQCFGGGNGEPNARNPVIFVPGIMGSTIRGNWLGSDQQFWVSSYLLFPAALPNVYNLTLDATSTYYRSDLYASNVIETTAGTNVYKPLLDSLKSAEVDYKPYNVSQHFKPGGGCDLSQKSSNPNFNPSLFVFPYDWRRDNNLSAEKLGQYIECVKQFYPPGTKIDIVAHSMGGLVVRRYILQSQNRNEPSSLGKVITIASPLLGAPESVYKMYTGGSWESVSNYLVIPPSAIQFLAPEMKSMHQLFPSRAYQSIAGGIVAEGGDVNGNGISDEVYPFPLLVSYLDSSFPLTTPGANGAGFHDFQGQDDWSNEQSDIQYSHIIAEQNQLTTTTTIGITKSIGCKIVGSNTLTNCHKGILYTPGKGFGDKTVPTLSASRHKNNFYLNAPNSMLYFWRSRAADDISEDKAEHTGITQNAKTHELLAYLLGRGQRPTFDVDPAQLGQNNTSHTKGSFDKIAETSSVTGNPNFVEYGNGQLPISPNIMNYSPSRYLTIVGQTDVIVRDENGNTASIENGVLNNQVEGLQNYEIIGDNSSMLTFSVDRSYTIEFPASENPMSIGLVEGRGNLEPTAATRYSDLDIPANTKLKLTISQSGLVELKYDADNDGEFETSVSPTIRLDGAAANDTVSPTVNINIVQQGNTATATIAAQDNQSGVGKIWYSFDGLNFQLYIAPVTIPYSTNPFTIEAFADDLAANRSGLYAKSFTFAQTQPTLPVKPVLECVTVNTDGTFTAKFGYLNENSIPVTIPVGNGNKFTPLPQDRGQTTAFQPGRNRAIFNVSFDGNNLVWTLRSPNGSQRTSTASRNSARCQL